MTRPCLTAITTCSVSPDVLGATRRSKLTVAKLGVPGKLPAAEWIAVRTA